MTRHAPSDPVALGERHFPVVGVGASAGGLEAFTQLLKHLPCDSGMAFVLIQHLDPNHASLLGETLARATPMVVRQAEDGMEIEPDHVYVIPPNAELAIRGGRLDVALRNDETFGPRLTIDHFFASLADDRGSQAIGVILSGTASDGTAGLRAIQAAEGITFAQEPRSAKFGGMPHSAVDAGVVDCCLPIPELAHELVRLSRHPYVAMPPATPEATSAAALTRIFAAVRAAVGVDYGEYNQPTAARRVARRMALRGLEDLDAYLALLEADPNEIRDLHEDMLIHVTSFFRDPVVFERLKELVFPVILAHKGDERSIRIWVAGCSTGEEVYSIAIALLEHLGDASRRYAIQIFGSDASEKAITTARAGVYADGAVAQVSAERRRRFFSKTDHGQRVNKDVRDLCIFVRHDLARDPPFARIDLASCRNVLIYFGRALQQRVLPRLHYCLNQPGFLLLGSAEGIPHPSDIFSTVDARASLFARTAMKSKLHLPPRAEDVRSALGEAVELRATGQPLRLATMERDFDRLLLAHCGATGVLIDGDLEVLSFRGETGAYLLPAPGRPQHNLLKMARGGVLAPLRRAIAKAKGGTAAITQTFEQELDGVSSRCELVVIPLNRFPNPADKLYVILFAKAKEPERPARSRPLGPPELADLERLRAELAATKDYLQTLNDQYACAIDDLEAANAELSSGNEELQSMNEELETAKEELQSTNEELTTVNDELRSRNLELNQVNGDLVNLIGTVDFPIVFLDRARCIRRFTPKARNILAVIPADVGRPIEDLKLNIDVPDLDRRIAEVIETMVMHEAEVRDHEGRWHRMQIRPYKTTDDRIDGAMLSLVDIDELKHHVSEAHRARAEAERANRAKDQFLATLSHELRTPLSSMLMQAQLLQLRNIDGAMVRQAGQVIERGTRLQVRLIDDLLDISRIVTGKLSVARVAVDVAQVVRASLEGIAAPAAAKKIRLRVDVDEHAGSVAGDAARLQQVVMNLLANAIKFTPQGGEVTLSLDREHGAARLRVADSGQGIDPAFLPHVWNRFSQEDSSSTRSYGGLGLGLAIVRHLVELHGGTVQAESRGTGQGATFTVTLPLLDAADLPAAATLDLASASAQPLATGSAEPHGAATLHGLSVLIVDDDAGTREAVAEMLRRSGACVQVTASAQQGLSAIAERPPALILCDIVMPEQDGYMFIRRVRALGAGRGGDIPALALTALAGEEDQKRALAAGFQMHLTKPVDLEHLSAAVLDLARQRPRPTNGTVQDS